MSISEAVVSDSEQAGHEVDAGRIDAGMTAGISRPGDYSWGVQGEKQELLFTGSGSEYFRIWIVNLCLTIATFGIYSAWAKVRRLQYFDRNTQLGGAVFNFHGEPLTILRGRLIAVLLLFMYHYLFELSRTLAVVIFILLLLGMPVMLRSAQRFRLRNTSYRGLRFDFLGSLGGAYLSYLPVVLLLVLPSLTLVWRQDSFKWLFWSLAAYLVWPCLHARMKRYQHGNFSFGNARSACDLKVGGLVLPYFFAGIFTLGSMVLVGIVAGVTVAGVKVLQSSGSVMEQSPQQMMVTALVLSLMLIFGYLAYVICGPYLQVRIWNRTWCATRLDGVTLQSQLPFWPYLRLQTMNVALTLLTLGLYRPFAVVRAYQFRLTHMQVQADSLRQFEAAAPQRGEHAAGDSSAEFFGFDLSW